MQILFARTIGMTSPISASTPLEGEKAVMDVTLFVRRRDGAFERRDERHIQYIYEEAEIVAALEKAGFSLLETEGHLGEEKSESDRLIFLARRK